MAKLKIKVDIHPSGRRTLKTKNEGSSLWEDERSRPHLFANLDKGEFYQNVALFIFETQKNMEIDYLDAE